MNVIDSSGWLEYFGNGTNADFFAPAILNTDELIVPAISIYEVFKRILREKEDEEALARIRTMSQGTIVPLTRELAIAAAYLSLELRLPMADSIIIATAQAYDATLWTQDADFEGIAGGRYVRKT